MSNCKVSFDNGSVQLECQKQDLEHIVHRLTAQLSALKIAQESMGAEYRAMEELEKAVEDILSNVALDWYVNQFVKSEEPTATGTGIVGMIHNTELRDRALRAFQRARDARAELKRVRGGE